MDLPFLQTKLHRPPAPLQQVQRPQLLTRLTQGLVNGQKLTLVIAPAGFGKTTLVNQWIEDLQLSLDDVHQQVSTPERIHQAKIDNFAWLSLDEYDNDFALFLGYIVAAIQRVFPTAGANTLGLLQASQLLPIHYMALTLLSELAELPADFILVMDDYHLIVEATIHQLMAQLIEHMPQQIHLVLTSRTEIPLPLARLRVRQQMIEIRTPALSFSHIETKAFLTQALGKSLSSETVMTLHTETEGWVTGLQLASLALQASRSLHGQIDETALTQSFRGGNRYVMDYLMEEVLARQPQPVQTFLVRTSILERFCAPLSETIVGIGKRSGRVDHPSAGQTILAYLETANLFVVPLDDQGDWYRYHHLFRALLRRRLQTHANSTEIAVLHRQASLWLASHGWIEEAVHQALAAGDSLTAARLVEQHRHELLNREDWRTLDRWLALLPEALVQQRPDLLLARAFILHFQYKFAAIPPLMQAAQARLADETLERASMHALYGEIDYLWSMILYWQVEGERSLVHAQQALERLPVAHLYVHGGILFYAGLAWHMTGQTTTAVQTLRAALDLDFTQPNTLSLRVIFALSLIHYLAGELTHMQQMAQDLWQMATQTKLGLSIGWGHYLLGIVHYEWNELETAVQHFAAIVELRYSIDALAVHNGWLGLAWTYQAQGRIDEARQQIELLLHFHREMNHLAFLPATYSFQARLALQQNDSLSALRWAQAVNISPAPDPMLFFELPQLTRAKVLLAQATTTSLTEATRLLTQLRQVAESTHNTMRQIELLALQALVEAHQERTELALTRLTEAVILAKPGRFIRTFVDLGPRLAGLLYQLGERGVEADYLGQVLAAFPDTLGLATLVHPMPRSVQANLVEPLTARELAVLALLALRLSNKEIAQTLAISPLTVRTHTTNIYQKLGVNSRKRAVARAWDLGLLSAE